MIVFGVLLIGVLILVSIFLFPFGYISELIISFLPYWTALVLGILVFSLFRVRKHKYYGFLVLFAGLVFLLFSKKITSFYNFETPLYSSGSLTGIRVLYANIYKNNTDYTGIIESIDSNAPDVLMFVEFAHHHYEHLRPYLKDMYPYTNSTSWSQTIVGSTVFSKFPLENWADDFPQGAWRYAYFSLHMDGQPYYFYLVHASSPVSNKNFLMRNRQIDTFFDDFWVHKKYRTSSQEVPIVVLGDFNTTPWSAHYRRFAQGFTSGAFVNITRTLPLLFTWKSLGIPFLWAHIDHLFVNTFTQISDFSYFKLSGSDHQGFLFTVSRFDDENLQKK